MRLRTLLSGDSEVQAAVLGTGCRYSGGESRREKRRYRVSISLLCTFCFDENLGAEVHVHLLDKACRTITGCTGTHSNISVLKL